MQPRPRPPRPARPSAQITLFNTPSPPTAIRPGEAELFHWEIVASTTPLSVSFKLINVNTEQALIESQVYPGASGLDVSRSYILPAGYTLPFGKLFERYRVRIEYYSLQAGNDSNAEAIFWVTQDTDDLQVVQVQRPERRQRAIRRRAGAWRGVHAQHPGPAGRGRDERGRRDSVDRCGSGQPSGRRRRRRAASSRRPRRFTPGAANTTTVQEFGNRTIPRALEALVFVDRDGSGSQDPGDLPFIRTTVSFLTPACSDMASGVTGSAAGTVLWTDRCVGEYLVWLDVPFGYSATTAGTLSTTVSSNLTTSVEFGVQGQGGLTACKFNDRNGDGAQGGGQGPMAGVRSLSQRPRRQRQRRHRVRMAAWRGDQPTGCDLCRDRDVPAGCMPTTVPYPPQVILAPGRSRSWTSATAASARWWLAPLRTWTTTGRGIRARRRWVAWRCRGATSTARATRNVTDATGILTWPSEPEGAYTVTASTLPGFAPTTPSTQTGAVLTAQTTIFDFGQRLRVGRLTSRYC